jgi:hypothetical protein
VCFSSALIGFDRRPTLFPILPACLKYHVRSDSASFPAILADLHFCVAHP